MTKAEFLQRTFMFAATAVRLAESLPGNAKSLRQEASEILSIVVSSIKTARKNSQKQTP